MVIRGAPAIGVAAAMGVALGGLRRRTKAFDREFEQIVAVLGKTRPTAVNLFWALQRMRAVYLARAARVSTRWGTRLRTQRCKSSRTISPRTKKLASSARPVARRQTDHDTLQRRRSGDGGLWHRAGRDSLAQGVGQQFEVFVNETRPFLQGARLTAWELKKEKIPATLVTDNMAGYLMQKGRVDAVVVGCDRVAANGDVANKIGTYMIAVLAKRHGIPFYVAGPTSSIDINCPSGKDIPIEQRDPKEVSHIFGKPLAPKGMKVFNPAFDVTPQELISAIITEKGVINPPYQQNIRSYVRD